MRRIAGGFVAGCVLVFVVVSPSMAATKTIVTFFSPWSSSGNLQPTYHVVETLSGYCWTDSIATSRGDAYRCMSGNSIYDPCFTPSAHPHAVACASNPFAKRIILLKLQKPLPSPPTPAKQWLQPHNQPWGLRLTNGNTCAFVTGATGAVDGERLNYACAHSNGWIVGQADHATALWTARSTDYPSKHIKHVSIAEVVF
jgi:hypothetical protein